MEISIKIEDIIREDEIYKLIEKNNKPDKKKILEILKKAEEIKGLNYDDAATLLSIEDDEILLQLFQTAKKVKELVYGNRIVLFAPLYLTSYCVNNCLYCAFRKDNKSIERMVLSPEEISEQVKAIINQGHKRLLLVCGEHPKFSALDYISRAVETAYKTKIRNGEIRRVHVNAAPMSLEDFKTLKSFNIGVFQSFQETYHKETYIKMHPSGPKADYKNRLTTMHRAIEAGLGDVGFGVLYGLYDYKFEVLATLMHSESLQKTFGIGPHTISIPRLEPAKGVPVSQNPPYPVSDKDFKKIIAVLRLAVPFTGIILTTRESPQLRNEFIHLGVSQMSAGSKTQPGGYSEKVKKIADENGQFFVADHRSLDEVVYTLCEQGFLPSFCTSCYRKGRVGEDFMALSKPGDIKNYCLPNAISTFQEYLTDFASEKTKLIGIKTIERNLDVMNTDNKTNAELLLEKIKHGKRDIYI